MHKDNAVKILKEHIDNSIDGQPNKDCIKILTEVADHIVSTLASFGVDY